MTEEEMLAEIFKIYVPAESAKTVEYRAYYNYTDNEIICFSQEELEHPYWVSISEEWYMTMRPDLFRIEDGVMVKKNINDGSRLQMKMSEFNLNKKFTSLRDDKQFPVWPDFEGELDCWNEDD
jgi:hypothetical protein